MEYIVYTTVMDEEAFLLHVERIITMLKKNNVSEIEILFGWAWEEEWIPIQTTVNDFYSQIKIREQSSGKGLHGNDVFLKMEVLNTEIIFCHESDIHIEFNAKNDVVSKILDSWLSEGIVQSALRNKEKISLQDLQSVLD